MRRAPRRPVTRSPTPPPSTAASACSTATARCCSTPPTAPWGLQTGRGELLLLGCCASTQSLARGARPPARACLATWGCAIIIKLDTNAAAASFAAGRSAWTCWTRLMCSSTTTLLCAACRQSESGSGDRRLACAPQHAFGGKRYGQKCSLTLQPTMLALPAPGLPPAGSSCPLSCACGGTAATPSSTPASA